MTACSLAAMQVTHSSVMIPAMAATTATATGKKITAQVSSVTRSTQDGGSKRAGGPSAGSSHVKSNKQRSSKLSSMQRQQQPHPVSAQPRPSSAQPHPVSAQLHPVSVQPHLVSAPSSSTTSNTVSYAGAVKSSPSLQDKKCSTVNKPVAYVKPTASTTNLADQQQEDITTMATNVESLSRMSSFPTAHLSQELLTEEDAIILTGVDEQAKPVKVTSNESTVQPAASFVSPVVTKSPSPVTATASTRLPSFVPFTFVASPPPSSVINQQAVITQVTTVTSTVTTQSGNRESGKEGIAEVEEVASKRRRLSPVPTTVRRTNIDHSTKLNIAADPFIPSSLPTAVSLHKSVPITAINMATPTVAATPSHKTSMPAACYHLPAAPMMPPHNMVPVIMPHPRMGSGYTISQAAYPSVFPAAVPSHTYQMPAHPSSLVGLPYAGYPMQQPTMLPPSAVTNNSVHNAASYSMFVPVTASNVLPPAPPPSAAAVHHARVEQRKKEEQIKALNDTKRFFEQNGSSVAKQQPPQLGYKYPTVAVKPQLPVTTEGGRRTLLENPPVAMAMPHLPMGSMMSRPLEITTSPSTGSKRKRRPPLMPLPQIPAANNITMATPWDKPTNTLY